MAYLSVDRTDGTSFEAVSNDGGLSAEGGAGPGAQVVFSTGWCLVEGQAPKVRTDKSQAGAESSRLFAQQFAGSAGNPSRTRYTLLESSGGGYVSQLDGSYEVEITPGHFIEVTNSNPPEIGAPQAYSATAYPETASAVASADETMQSERPQS